jgi:Tfp pilus assembly protein PilF
VQRIEKLNEFLKTSPKDCFLRHALALEYIKIGDDATAETLFIAVLADDPGYVGTYYHLAKLLERNQRVPEAINWYQKGMEASKKANDAHAFNELRAALEELEEE